MHKDEEKIYWLQLYRSENIGPATFKDLIRYYKTPKDALQAIPEIAAKGGRKNIKICPYEVALKEYEKTKDFGGDIIISSQDEYPELLRHISDAPPVLSVIGDVSLLNKQSIAIVGTRNATINGKQFAKKIAYDLVGEDYVVVSGLALGIDRKAHEGALMKNGGDTIAVIGCGIDVCYPERNIDIYEQIKKGGLIVSEFPLGSSPQAMNFPRRNRIISGLSLGVIVVEAQLRSGSLITAKMALEQNREVFAVPGSPLDARGSGPNSLIKQGAHLIENAMDVCEVFKSNRSFVLREESLSIEEPEFSRDTECDIDSARKKVLENFGANSISIDSIIEETGISYSTISLILLELELAGRLERHPGGYVSLIME